MTAAGEFTSADLSSILLWDKAAYIGVVTVPVAWMVFVLEYTGRGAWLMTRNVVLLCFVPVVTLLLDWTNELHGLIFSRFELVSYGSLSIVQVTWGTWFWVFAAYSYLLITLGTVMLLHQSASSQRKDRWQTAMLVVAVLVPLAASGLDVFGFVYPVDLTPMAFTFTGFAVFLAVFRFRLFEIMPVAREAVIRDMGDGVIVLDMNNHVVGINPAGERMIGYKKAEALGKPIAELLKLGGLDVQALANWPSEINLTRVGSQHYFDVRQAPLHDRVGGLIGYVTVLHDVTDRKRAEEELRRKAQELTALQATVLDITSIPGDLQRLLDAIVERAVRLLGAGSGGLYLCDPKRREARCVVSHSTPQDFTGVVLKYGEGAAGTVAETGKPLIIDDYRKWEGRASVYEKDKPFGAVLSAPMLWQNQVTGVIHVMEESTVRCFTQADLELLMLFANHAAIAVQNARLLERAQHQAADLQRYSMDLERMVAERTAKLAESEDELRLLADSLPALISYVDSEQRYRFNNKAYEEWFGQPVSEIIGRQVREVLGEPTYQRIRPRIEAALSGKTQSYEYELPHRSRGTRYVRAQYVPDFGEYGQVKGIFVLTSDITERKQMEERLLRAERLAAIGETAAMVGHDLRNPLQAISCAAHILKKKLTPVGDEETREMLEAVENSVAHSDNIVNDLLEYSEDIRLELSETTPKSITRDALLDVKIPKNIAVSDMASHEPKMRVDTAKIKRIFINLIENAVDSMPNGGKLTITSNKSNNSVELMFTDTGVGIPEQILRHLWKPLITTKPKGIGLGLAICKRIAEAHGGSIVVDSKEGKGTTFTLTLPLTSQEGAKTT
jgi:PAS domain S-box-containing protein